jgi:hypothetical protein
VAPLGCRLVADALAWTWQTSQLSARQVGLFLIHHLLRMGYECEFVHLSGLKKNLPPTVLDLRFTYVVK